MAGEGTSTYAAQHGAAPSSPRPRSRVLPRLFFFQFSRAERTSNSLILFRDFNILKQYEM